MVDINAGGWPLFWGGFVFVAGVAVIVLDWLGGEL